MLPEYEKKVEKNLKNVDKRGLIT